MSRIWLGALHHHPTPLIPSPASGGGPFESTRTGHFPWASLKIWISLSAEIPAPMHTTKLWAACSISTIVLALSKSGIFLVHPDLLVRPNQVASTDNSGPFEKIATIHCGIPGQRDARSLLISFLSRARLSTHVKMSAILAGSHSFNS